MYNLDLLINVLILFMVIQFLVITRMTIHLI